MARHNWRVRVFLLGDTGAIILNRDCKYSRREVVAFSYGMTVSGAGMYCNLLPENRWNSHRSTLLVRTDGRKFHILVERIPNGS